MDWHLQKHRIGMTAKAMAALWLLASVAIAADEPEIAVSVRQDEVFVGDSIDYQVEIRNSKNPSAPDLSAVKQQFDVVANGDISENRSSAVISNGRLIQQNSFKHIYRYQLTPKTSGNLTIPAVTATIDGKSITSDEVSIRVIEAEKQDLVLVEIETSHTRVYPTQPFTVTARIFVHPLPKGANQDPLGPVRGQPPHLQINWADPIPGLSVDEKSRWLQPLLAEDGIGFSLNDVATRTNSFFDSSRQAVFGLFKGREPRDGLDGKPIQYFVYELARTFTPEKAGEYVFGPAIVKGTFVAGVDRREYTGRRLVSIAPAKTVEVREVPSPRPANFCGGIGQYKITASATPTKLRIGDPLTLTVEIERGPQSGSLELVSAPDLSAMPQVMEDFDLIDRNPTGRVEGSVKKFAYALRPKRADVGIPPLIVSTFDLQSEDFVETQTAAIQLEVSEAARVTGGDLVGNMPATTSTTIKSRSQGIFQNVTDPAELRDERIDVIAYGKASAGVWITSLALVGLITMYRRKSSDPRWIRRQQARKTANRRLADARQSLAAGESKQALIHVRSAILGVVADLQNRIVEGFTTADVAAALSTVNVSSEDRSAILQLLEAIESAEYGAGQTIEPAAAIESATSLIGRIAPILERGA